MYIVYQQALYIELAGKLPLHHNRTGEVVFITKKNYTLLSRTVIAS